jgi:hypothetical protein
MEEEINPENAEVETRTLFHAAEDRQTALNDLRASLGEVAKYFSARTNEALWRGVRMAEDELDDLLEDINAMNDRMMRG